MRNKQYALLGAPKYNDKGQLSYADVLKLRSILRHAENAAKANVESFHAISRDKPHLTQLELEQKLELLDNFSL